MSSDTWPGTGGVLGLTKAQIAAAKAEGVKPAGGAGFAYMQGPDNAIVEYQGNMPAERFNHVHLYQEDPFCAQLWYQKHLGGTPVASRVPGPVRTEANCKVARSPDRTWPALEKEGMFRVPTAAVTFGDVALTWYANPGDTPLATSRGQLYDHIALSVSDLDAWVDKAPGRGRDFPRGALQDRRHPRRHDRGAEPRSDRTRRGQMTAPSPSAGGASRRLQPAPHQCPQRPARNATSRRRCASATASCRSTTRCRS